MNASSILIVLVALATPSMVWATEPPLKTFDGTWKGFFGSNYSLDVECGSGYIAEAVFAIIYV